MGDDIEHVIAADGLPIYNGSRTQLIRYGQTNIEKAGYGYPTDYTQIMDTWINKNQYDEFRKLRSLSNPSDRMQLEYLKLLRPKLKNVMGIGQKIDKLLTSAPFKGFNVDIDDPTYGNA